MKILVTGGAGFIGSNFILYWLNHYPDDYIINVDKLTYAGNLENLKSIEKNSHYRFSLGDICDPEFVKSNMKGVDTVIHFAAESHVDRSIIDPSVFMKTNVLGTQVLLDAARSARVSRFHHISTDEVFGALELDSTEKFSENTPYDPRSPYSASKAGSDHVVRAYYYTYGLPVTITNCSNNFGPFQFPEKFIPLTITNIMDGVKIPVYGDGLYIRDWLYVEDHCRAIDLVLQRGRIGETYCIGGVTESISNLDIVKKIMIIMNRPAAAIEFVKDRPGHDRRYAVNWSRIRNELGFSPRADFDTYLKDTVAWYQQHESWWKKVKNGQYRKYYQKQYGEVS